MKPSTTEIVGSSPAFPAIPPLEPGDRLTRDEFERRYHAMPNQKASPEHATFIERLAGSK